jgi:hypothetical protein
MKVSCVNFTEIRLCAALIRADEKMLMTNLIGVFAAMRTHLRMKTGAKGTPGGIRMLYTNSCVNVFIPFVCGAEFDRSVMQGAGFDEGKRCKCETNTV